MLSGLRKGRAVHLDSSRTPSPPLSLPPRTGSATGTDPGRAAQARAFFASVYAVGGVDRGALHAHEKAFWSTHRRLVKVEKKAKRDKEDLYRVLLVLQRRLPDDLCGKVLQLAL